MKRRSKRLFSIALLLAMSGVYLQTWAINAIKREFRGVWVSTVYNLDWPTDSKGKALQGRTTAIATQQKERLCQILDDMKKCGFNVIFFQVRPMSDALYKSSYEPWSSYLTGTRGAYCTWDPLEYAVAEAHKRGLELHAWVNPYRWAGSPDIDWNTTFDQQVKSRGWVLTSSKGKILNPGIPAVRSHIVKVCKEIISKYNVDGLVFDDYFYNSGTPEDNTAGDYLLYKNSGTTLSMADWRRKNVNDMVQAVYDMVQETKPYVRFGISPAGVASKGAADVGLKPFEGASDWQYGGIYSDPLAWLSKGNIDYISPQLYWPTTHTTNPFGPLTKWWSDAAAHFNRHHYASHSISALGNSNTQEDWTQYGTQIQLNRNYSKNKAPGCVLFRSGFISGPNAEGLGVYLKNGKFARQAISPEVDWKEHDTYGEVEGIILSGDTLKWSSLADEPVRFTVYAIPDGVSYTSVFRSDGDGILSDYLVGMAYDDFIVLPKNRTQGYGYAVCILDGYGKEYSPKPYKITGIETIGIESFAVNISGQRLQFNLMPQLVCIYNMSGLCVARYEHTDDITVDLPNGVYVVKALSQSGSSITCKFILH